MGWTALAVAGVLFLGCLYVVCPGAEQRRHDTVVFLQTLTRPASPGAAQDRGGQPALPPAPTPPGSESDPLGTWRWGTDYKANYEEFYRVTRDPNSHVHHILPQQYRDILARAGINVDDPLLLREVQAKPAGANNLHQIYYTNRWGEFARSFSSQGRTPTAQEIVRFAQQLEQEYYDAFGTAFYRTGPGMPGRVDWQKLWDILNAAP